MDIKDFDGQRVLVSGGTGGLGFAAAKLLARRGASLVVSGRSEERGRGAVDELTRLGARAAFVRCDLARPDEVTKLCADAAGFLGGIDVLISAGADNRTGLRPFADFSVAQIREVFDGLVYPRILPVHAAIPYLKQSGRGVITMLGTDAARHPTPGESIVGSTGAVVIVLTKTLARELARDRVRVNSVALTITAGTPGWDRAFTASEMGNKVFSKAVARFPFGRPPHADDVAEAMVFLSSPAASQISGQTLSVNGALSFGGW